MCEALIYLLDHINIRFGTKLYTQIFGIPMGTYCAPLVADLFLFCYERHFMTSLSDVKQAEIIEAFNPSHAAIKISINATAAEFICKNIFPTPVQIKKK